MKGIRLHIILAAVLAALLAGCEKEEHRPGGNNVFIVYSMGFTNIDSYLNDDIRDITSSYIPGQGSKDNILLIFSQNVAEKKYPWKPSEAVLYEMSKDKKGKICKKVLLRLPSSAVAASPEVLEQVLSVVQDEYPGKNYGMLMSSHGSGWAPMSYCLKPSKYEADYKADEDDGVPFQKSIGDHYDGMTHSSEIDIKDLAAAIPMKLDYLIFDACFMGGIEVAYELRDKVGRVIFSQSEIAGEGMDYENMVSLLLKGSTPALEQFCHSFYRLYEHDTTYGCMISMVNAGRTKMLASVCKYLNGKYDISDSHIEKKRVQRFFRTSSYYGSADYSYFYDLPDIYRNAGADNDELALLEAALDECIECRYATPKFMYNYGGFEIKEYSGLSMYLPISDRAYLNSYYRGLEWNKATALVK